jgi:uncharacterized protein YjiS (DUF1127 family)
MALWLGPFHEALLEAGRWLAGPQHSRLRQRAALRDLDDRLLADVGISREEARRGRPLGTPRPRRACTCHALSQSKAALVTRAGPGR